MPGAAAGAALGIGTGIIQDLWQLGLGNQMADDKMGRDKHMMNFQMQKMLEMWQKTGYGPTVEAMKKAGLNPALLYGMGGAGGQTAAGPTATTQMPETPKHDNVGMGIQAGLQMPILQAQKENIEADTEKKRIEAAKLAGVDTKQVEVTIEKLAQETDNMREEWVLKRYQQKILALEGWQKEQSMNDQLQILDTQAKSAAEQLKIISTDAEVKQATKEAIIQITRQQIVEQAVRIAAGQKGMEKTDAEIAKMSTDIQQQWMKLAQETRGLDQKDKEIKIKEFEANIKAAYPGLWNVAGKIITDTERLMNNLFNETTVPVLKK